MQKLILILIGSLAAGTTQAADLPTYFKPVTSYDPVAVSDQPARFNWDSYLVGAAGSIEATDPMGLGAEVFAGVTATADQFLYGGVLSAGLLSGGEGGAYVEITSRFGVLVTDEVAAFAIVGGGYETRFSDSYGIVGGGVSVAVAESMTIDATLKANYLNGAPGGGEWRLVAGVGLAFHF